MQRTARGLAGLTFLLLTGLIARDARATWPPPANATREQLADPSNWPNDPGYGPDSNHRNGQYPLWSWIPQENLAVPGFRRDEVSLGAGNQTDGAWTMTTGDPRVLIAVLDSGFEWDSNDVQSKIALNTAELPLPQRADGTALAAYDGNGDGVVNIIDYQSDPRITCGTTLPHPLRECRGADGMPNDPNRNGVFDAGDLIRTFSDNVDDDHNGYTDDIAGWDFYKDDNDPYDDTRYGHGTGESHDSAGETNNGIGEAGDCPRCMLIPVRAGDSFLGESADYAQALLYAADRGASVLQAAFVTLDHTPFAMAAIDYAYAHGMTLVSSAGDENSRHHMMPGTNNHTLYVHAIRPNAGTPQGSYTYLAFNNCSNYGGQAHLSTAGDSCASEATGHTSGIAGLIYSMGLQTNLTPPLSSEEVKQIFIGSADDINVPESVPGAPNYDRRLYQSLPGWDQRFNYGRTNARRAVEWVRDRHIPPEVDITSPRWFTTFYNDRPSGRMLRLEGRIAARRAPTFDYVVEWAPGIEPQGNWTQVRMERNVTAPVTDALGFIDLTNVHINNPGEVENRFTVTIRVRAIAHYDAPIGDVPGEARRVVYVTSDPDLLPNFPLDVVASGESSPHMADLDEDGRNEIVSITADGFIHAFRADATELPGFPVHTNLIVGADPNRTPSYRNAPAYSGPNRAFDPDRIYEFSMGAPGIADLDGDGHVEIVVAGYHGTLYVFNRDGTPYGHGFPYTLPTIPSSMNSPEVHYTRGMFASPLLYDLDGDGHREIIVGAFDGNVYAFRSQDATQQPGFPVEIHSPLAEQRNRVWGSVGVGHFDGDTIPDLVAVSNERLQPDENYGAFYVLHGDGNRHAGGAYHPNWPLEYYSFHILPLIGEGTNGTPAVADVDGDGRDDLALGGVLSNIIIAQAQQPAHPPRPETNTIPQISYMRTDRRGVFSNTHLNPVSFINGFALGSFGDLDQDGVLDYMTDGATLQLAIAASGGLRTDYDQLIGAWNARTGAPLPGFPRVIEDYTFFQNPIVADVSGDPYPEVITASAGYYVHAVDACGRDAPGFPKFTGQWVAPSPVVGDLDNDHTLEMAVNTRSGFLYAWRTRGRTDGNVQWPTYRHDNANTGNYGTHLDFGTLRSPGAAPIACPVPATDAGVADGATDGSADARGPVTAGGGCGCRTAGTGSGSRGATALSLGALALVLAARARRRRHRRPRRRSAR